jgi:hypothetical protein
VFLRGRIIGKEEITFDDKMYDVEQTRLKKSNLVILHKYSAVPTTMMTTTTSNNDSNNYFKIHMINGYFEVSLTQKFTNSSLHERFVNLGYYSRFDPCSSSSVNLRFHYNEATNYNGKCPIDNKTACTCKDISVLCFGSGKINVTGLHTLEQGKVIHAFIMDFFRVWKGKEALPIL